jgi:hypothetical protein
VSGNDVGEQVAHDLFADDLQVGQRQEKRLADAELAATSAASVGGICCIDG